MKKTQKSKDVDLNKLSFAVLKSKVSEMQRKVDEASIKKVGVWEVGKNYFIRTVTMALMGKLVEVTEKELVLESASWIADTGRFATFLQGKTVDEVEPFPEGRVLVGRGALIDATIWQHDLLSKQK